MIDNNPSKSKQLIFHFFHPETKNKMADIIEGNSYTKVLDTLLNTRRPLSAWQLATRTKLHQRTVGKVLSQLRENELGLKTTLARRTKNQAKRGRRATKYSIVSGYVGSNPTGCSAEECANPCRDDCLCDSRFIESLPDIDMDAVEMEDTEYVDPIFDTTEIRVSSQCGQLGKYRKFAFNGITVFIPDWAILNIRVRAKDTSTLCLAIKNTFLICSTQPALNTLIKT